MKLELKKVKHRKSNFKFPYHHTLLFQRWWHLGGTRSEGGTFHCQILLHLGNGLLQLRLADFGPYGLTGMLLLVAPQLNAELCEHLLKALGPQVQLHCSTAKATEI